MSVDRNQYVKELFEVELLVCERCKEEVEEIEIVNLGGQFLCLTCYDEYSVNCGECEARVWLDTAHADGNIYICDNCYEHCYSRCFRCDCLIHHDNALEYDDEIYCPTCHAALELEDEVIQPYCYKPTPIFYGEGIHYGLELEVDGAGKEAENASKILNIANQEAEHIYIKHDGSLTAGFEIVSHPMTLAYHTGKMRWHDIVSKLCELGYLSHQTRTCGLHIHVEKAYLGGTEDEENETISKILYFVERHWHELLKFSRRTGQEIQTWASRYGYKESPSEILHHAKNGSFGRYVCVNLQNAHTVEFRMYKGTLKYTTFLATLQMTDEICKVALSLSQEELKALTWLDFVQRISENQKAELIAYLKLKRLYVNEFVENQEG